MESSFWHGAWERKEIRFHEASTNPLLIRNLPALQLAAGARIFVPLCGKSLDMHFLLEQGFRVVGAELSSIAVRELFDELKLVAQVAAAGRLERYEAGGLTVYAGDMFDLDAATLGGVDAVYDRAALVALPPAMRDRYTPHLAEMIGNAPQLLACFEYGDGLLDAPPHSIEEAEVRRRYETMYSVKQLERYELREGLKGKSPVYEAVYLLRKK